MTLKIKCTYVAEGEPFTLGRSYEIYCVDGGMYYIKDDSGRNVPYRHIDDIPVIDGLVRNLNDFWHSKFKLVNTDERSKIRKTFQRRLIQYNMDIADLSGHLIGKPSNVISAQIAMLKVKREAIQELYDEVFKGGDE